MKHTKLLVVALVSMLGVVGCNRGGETPTDETVHVEKVDLNKSAIKLQVGGHVQLTAKITPENATVKDVTYSSSNTAVATVSTEGLVTAVGVGPATITVTTADGSKTATCNIEVLEHFEELKSYLDALGIKYERNKLLVRGLDYYNRTVFEIKSNNLGSQNAVCGGGRYDGLIEMLGGVPTSAVGWAMGMERLNSLLPQIEAPKIDYYVVSDNTVAAVKLVQKLREQGRSVEFDYQGKKFGKQFEKAGKIAKFAVILGEDEIKNSEVSVKNMETGEQKKYKLDEFLNK